MKFTSLAWRFAFWFIVVAVLPLALFGYLSLQRYEADLRIEALGRLSRLADKKTLQIKTYLGERELDTKLLARGKQVQAALQDAAHAYRHGPASAEYRKAAKPIDAGFSAYIGSGEDALYYDAFLITPGGEVVYTYKHEADFATNLFDGPWRDTPLAQAFRESRMTLESSVSDFDQYPPSGAPAAFVTAPVFREGRLLGVIAMQLDTQRIYRVALDNSGLGATGETPLVKLADNGMALFVAPLRRDPQAAMQRRVDLKQGAVPIRRALSGQRGAGVEVDYAGRQAAAAWRYLPELNLGMVVKMDADEVFASLRQERGKLLEALLALMLFAAAASFYFGRRLIVPLKGFAATASEIAGGDLDKRVDETRADEIGALGRAFNRMAGSLQASYRTLEERVEERTHELQVSNEQLQEEIIEREHIEKALRESQTLYSATFDLAAIGIAHVAPDGRWLNVNQKLCDIVGYTREELLALTFQDITHPDDLDADLGYVLKMLAGEIPSYSMEKRYFRKDREIIWINLSVTLVWRADGKPDYFISLIEDISGRKQAEEELGGARQREAEALRELRAMLDTSGEGFWKMDQSGRIIEVNDAYCRITGYGRDEIVGSHVARFEANEQTQEAVAAHIQRIVERGYDRFETRHRHRDGHLVDIEVAASFIGDTHCLIAFLRDVTERKLAQVELQHKQNMLNEAQRLGQLGSWELDLVNGNLSWSDEVYRIFELDPLLFSPSYENFLNVIHPDERDKVDQAYTQSLRDRQPYDIEHRLRMADGRIKWVREHCTSEFDAAGKPLRSVGAVQDITAYKLAGDELRIAAAAFETHEAIVITDAGANIVRVNHAFQRITGYTQQEVLGRNPRIFSSGRHDKAFYEAMWDELLKTGSWAGEVWDRRKNGEIYPKWMTISAVKNQQGETTEYVSIFGDITERKQAEEEIRNLAFYDALTGLPNRRLLLDHFQLAQSVSARSLHYGVVLFLDMDRFKILNDTLGHDHGDLLLLEVAKRIQSCVREMDTVARLGGDEFVVLVEEISASAEDALQRAALIAEKIRMALSEPYQLKEHEYHSSPSVGVCLYRGAEESVDDLLKHADLAMYQAKDSGRNAVRFFDPAMQRAVEAHAALEKDLHHAISEGQLRLHYQVQIDGDHRPIGAEALIRWAHPERGMVSPAQFIPVAEESALILEIGQWVLETACQQLALWGRSDLTRHLELAINVSAQQFGQHDFVQRLEQATLRHGIAPDHLKLELTESVVLKDVADVVAKMHALKAIGFKLSLDDFGTGYSSLSYLKKLPLDQIKIDQSFVRDATSDQNDAVMVKTIIGMAQNFRLNVIAEGVETEAQLAFLKQNGCMAYQGYLFGRPVAVAEFENLVRNLCLQEGE